MQKVTAWTVCRKLRTRAVTTLSIFGPAVIRWFLLKRVYPYFVARVVIVHSFEIHYIRRRKNALIRNARMLRWRVRRFDRHLGTPARALNDPPSRRFYRPRFAVRQWQRQQRAAAGDKQRQWNDKRNDKQERVNKGPARAEKRTSARQARVAYNHPMRWVAGGRRGPGQQGKGGWRPDGTTRVAARGVAGCVRDDRQRYRIHSGRDIAARFANFQQQAARVSPCSSTTPRSMHLEAPVRRCVVESLINWI